jgi:hypothetical protein
MATLETDPLARGRARIEPRPDGTEIVIPAKREWPMLLFLLCWLGAWTVGGVTVIGSLISGTAEDEAVPFTLFWLGAWALGMVFVGSVLTWGFFGREIVSVTSEALTVTRKAGPYRREKRFARERVERLRIDAYRGALREMFDPRNSFRRGMEMWGLSGGSIVFDYGARTHSFGNKLDDAESRQIVRVLGGDEDV